MCGFGWGAKPMRRRDLITALGGTAAYPLAARAQHADRMRRIGVLMPFAADDPEAQPRFPTFAQGFEPLRWTFGPDGPLHLRWATGDPERIRRGVAELLALEPDAVLATGSTTVGPLRQATRTVSIVFVAVPDPVGAGFVANLARPGGNVTGFMGFEEYGISP